MVEELFPRLMSYLRTRGDAYIGEVRGMDIDYEPYLDRVFNGEIRPVIFNGGEIAEVIIYKRNRPRYLRLRTNQGRMKSVGLDFSVPLSTDESRIIFIWSDGRRRDTWHKGSRPNIFP